MAGHSAWKNIKHKKAAADKRRGKTWSKASRAILSAAKQGGGDPKFNVTLRYAVDEAKAANMPKDTIEKLIKKATGEGSDANTFVHVRYEGYGPGGVAILVDCLTDNVQRTAPNMRLTFEKAGGNLGKPGAVSFGFSQKGVILIESGKIAEERLMELALDAGADDVIDSGGAWQVTTEPASFLAVKEAIEAAGIEVASSEITMIPANTVSCDAVAGERVMRLINSFEDDDDVQKVHHNAEIPDEVLAAIG